MSKRRNLIDKYLAAKSTLEEEEKLFENAANSNSSIEAWFSYVKGKRRKAPTYFNDRIWASIQSRKRKKRRFTVGLSLAAASIALFITVSVNNPDSNNGYQQKQKSLNEALSMFPNEEQVQTEASILYEDEMVIIYTVSK